MNKIKLNKVIQDGNIVIPLYILKRLKELNLTSDEFIFLMYLYNRQDNLDFNPEKISLDLNLDIMEVMGYISVLADKGYLTLDVKKTTNNILEEVINLSNFYEKVSMMLINTEDEKPKTNIIDYIEKELGRKVSETEVDLVNNWLNNNIDDELIKEAFKIAINDGVYSIKYIDKVLFDWNKRGFKRVDDIKSDHIDEQISEDVTDWDWLDDEEEYIVN